jgi:hypothetical protein
MTLGEAVRDIQITKRLLIRYDLLDAQISEDNYRNRLPIRVTAEFVQEFDAAAGRQLKFRDYYVRLSPVGRNKSGLRIGVNGGRVISVSEISFQTAGQHSVGFDYEYMSHSLDELELFAGRQGRYQPGQIVVGGGPQGLPHGGAQHVGDEYAGGGAGRHGRQRLSGFADQTAGRA